MDKRFFFADCVADTRHYWADSKATGSFNAHFVPDKVVFIFVFFQYVTFFAIFYCPEILQVGLERRFFDGLLSSSKDVIFHIVKGFVQ
jgi:hypothetical protein